MKTAITFLACLLVGYVVVMTYFYWAEATAMAWYVWHCAETVTSIVCPFATPIIKSVGASFTSQILSVVVCASLLFAVVQVARRGS